VRKWGRVRGELRYDCRCRGVIRVSGGNVRVEVVNVEDLHRSECRSEECCGVEWWVEMVLGEYWLEVMQVYVGIASIPLFRVDVPLFSQGIGFLTETSRTEADDEVESRVELQPTGLSAGQEFSGQKIF
jgi:hypothetical protein